MRLISLPNKRLWLQAGEVVPVVCACGVIYVPDTGSASSVCPACSKEHNHLEFEREIALGKGSIFRRSV